MTTTVPVITTLPPKTSRVRKLTKKLASEATTKIIVGVIVYVSVNIIGNAILDALKSDDIDEE